MSIIQGTSKAAGGAVYEIDQSVRFNDDDAAYLYRDVTSAPTDGKKFTYSVWIKRGVIGSSSNCGLLSGSSGTSTGRCDLRFTAGAATGDGSNFDSLKFDIYSGGFDQTRSIAKLRDTSSWYHIVFVFDAANATANDTMIMYLNGARLELDSTSGIPNVAALVNANGQRTRIGADASNTPVEFDGYMAEINMIDGQALDPTSFGETNDDGVWIPKPYDGSYGSNGFYLTGATASDLGEDFSGNNNDFTSSGGLATTDQMSDTPTDNYSVLNPLSNSTGAVPSDGNLKFATTSSATGTMVATIPVSSGKWYCEVTVTTGSSNGAVGIRSVTQSSVTTNTLGSQTLDYAYRGNGQKFNSNTKASYGSAYTTGAVVGIALDLDGGTIKFFNDNSDQGTAYSSISGTFVFAVGDDNVSSAFAGTFNFGQSAFTYTPPTGYVALSTANLPTPSITDGSAHFQPTLYTGTGSSLAVTQSGNSTFQPDFVWIKGRSGATEHVLTDAVRGVTKELSTNDAGTEETVAQGLTAFGSSGFTVGTDGSYNTSSATYVGWQWAANGSGSSNTDGDITSTVSANTTAGFSIVTATPSLTGTENIGHGLGLEPKMILGKNLDLADNWYVYHDAISPAQSISLNTTGAATTTRYNAATTSSVFQIVNGAWTNGGQRCLWYCFAEIPGYSSIGSYTGNGSTDGPFVYTGFTPSFILTKNINTADQWGIRDATRNPFNVTDKLLNPNASTAETSSATGYIDILSNGFKPRSSDSNINTQTIIYMAFAENPFGGDGVAPATAR